MTITQWFLWIGGGASAVFGTGGIGYAIIQAWLKRNDKEAQANAAKILTGVASDMVRDLREDNLNLRKDNTGLKKEIRGLRVAVDHLMDIVDDVIPLLDKENLVMSDLKEALKTVKVHIYN